MKAVHKIGYKGFWIRYNPKPIPANISPDWDWWHDDYDGAPDSTDSRCGCERSEEACRAAIDEWLEENEAGKEPKWQK